MFQTLSNNNICITGTEIESLVYAIDLIGHKSKTAKSNGIIIDTTHPETTLMEHLEENIAVNPSFEKQMVIPLTGIILRILICVRIMMMFKLYTGTSLQAVVLLY
jgi:hypothetical protein